MTMFCVPTWIRDDILEWSEMPIELWNSLCIPHQIAVLDEFNADPQVRERQMYGDPMPGEFA